MYHPQLPAEPPLRAYLFVSSASPTMTPHDLRELYAVTAGLNLSSGICGAMLYIDGNIMQYIEGPSEAVANARRRIVRSRRHVGVMALLDQSIDERSYDGFDLATHVCGGEAGLIAATRRWMRRAPSMSGTGTTTGLLLLARFWAGQAR